MKSELGKLLLLFNNFDSWIYTIEKIINIFKYLHKGIFIIALFKIGKGQKRFRGA